VDGHGVLANRPVEYPESDGKPMAESDAHRDEMQRFGIEVLADHFAGRGDVYVSGNNFVYYRRGDPRGVVSPDVYVVRGVPQRLRPTFKVWEEGGARPCFALEVTSHTTRENDLGEKMMRYRDDLRVAEYFLFDLTGDWIPEHLRAYRLEGGEYRRLTPGDGGRVMSEQLGLELARVDGHLRFYLPGAALPLPNRAERAARAQAEAARAQAENEALRAELERLRGE